MNAAERSLIIMGIRGVPGAHGGFETFAERLAPYLAERGWRVTVYCQGSPTGKLFEDKWGDIHRVHIPVTRTGSLGTIEFDAKCTADVRSRPGTILTLGYNTGFLSSWLRLQRRENYINMDGLEWKRDKYGRGARAYLWVNELLAAQAGTGLIADHPVIAAHLAKKTSSSRISMIPYGSDYISEADPALLAPLGLEPSRFLTLIARPVPENSVLEIVRAFSAQSRGAKLAVLGVYDRSNSYLSEIQDIASEEVVFPGAIYDKSLLASLRFHSIAYLHGHRVGGTNPSLVEALGAGNAIIAHDNPFNRWVVGEAGVFFSDVESCSAHIDRLLNVPAFADMLRTRARDRWAGEFTWPKVLESYEHLLTRI